MANNNDTTDIVNGFKNFGKAVIDMVNMSGENLINRKIDKHINLDNDDKVAQYLVCLFNPECDEYDMIDEFAGNYPPDSTDTVKKNPVAMKAIKFLKSKGWRIRIGDYKAIGVQLVALSPDGEYCYHSKWRW